MVSTQENEEVRSWEKIADLLRQEDKVLLEDYIESISARELVRALSHMPTEDQTHLLTLLSPDYSAYLLEEIPDVHASKLIEKLPTSEAATILNEMQSSEQADLLATLSDVNAEAILAEMKPEEAEDARMLLSYEPDVAGGLMITEYLAFKTTDVVKDVVENMTGNAETYSDYHVQYIYVVSKAGKLEGVLRIPDLLLSKPSTVLSSIMYLGLVVGGALALNMLMTVSLRGSIPLILKRLGMDPAPASSPILTTITDMFGFFLVLSFATAILPLLQ